MPLTPQDVQQKEFRQQFRGYNEVEVDAFLDEVEVELGRLFAENEDLRQRLAQSAAQPAPAPVAMSGMAEGEEMLRRTLLLAQRTADETVASAQVEAQRLLEAAKTQAEATASAAQSQARATVGELDRRRQELEVHIEGLRAFEREYRTRLKAYLETQLRDLDGRGQAAAAPARAQVPPVASPPPVTPPPTQAVPNGPTFTAVSPPPAAFSTGTGGPEVEPETPRVAP